LAVFAYTVAGKVKLQLTHVVPVSI